MSAVESRYGGICATCEERFPEGTAITYDEQTCGWSHATCPEPADDYDVRFGICSECFTTIAANGACSCDE